MWNYRVIEFEDDHLAVHEVYYENDDKTPRAYASDPADLWWESCDTGMKKFFIDGFTKAFDMLYLKESDFVSHQ